MTRSTYSSILLALPVLLMGTMESYAWSKNFPGTRDQVRNACKGPGMVLVENTETNNTACANDKNGTAVSCNDAGRCQGTGPGPMPRMVRFPDISGMGGVMGVMAPQSTVPTTLSTEGSGPATMADSMPAPAPVEIPNFG